MPCPNCASIHGSLLDDGSDRWVFCLGCEQIVESAQWGKSVGLKRKRNTYDDTMHGGKGRAQKKYKTSGKTHQSEHPIGYEVIGQGTKRGKSSLAKTVENTAPAYQEEKESHRGHIGTGSWKRYRGSNVSSDDYRKWQRELLKQALPGVAIQLNQLLYGHQKEFRSPSKKIEQGLVKGDKSFENMVESFPGVHFKQDNTWLRLGVTEKDKAEMLLSRMSARSGDYVTRKDELKVMKQLGLVGGQLEKKPKKGPQFTLERDPWGIPKDGNCLFHSIWDRLNRALPNMGFTTNDDLRRMAVGFLRFDEELNMIGAVSTEYVLVMEQNGTWGGELEALALAYVWGVSITVHAPDYQITYNPNATTKIDIYYNGENHYSIGHID